VVQQCLDALQLQYWVRYIRFEQHQSPHILKQDSGTFRARVILAWRQALLYLGHYPNMWADYVKFLADTHSTAEEVRQAQADFEVAMPYSPLPRLIRADGEEEAQRMGEAKTIYESLLQCKAKDQPPDEAHSFKLPDFVVAERRVVEAAKAKAEEQNNSAAAAPSASAAAAAVKPEEGSAGEDSKMTTTADESIVDIYQGELHQCQCFRP
jgi:hypothetical protein